MANNLYDRSFTGNKEVYKVSQEMFWESLDTQFWGKFAKFTTPDGAMVDQLENVPAVMDAPIVMHRELIQKMGDMLQIPTLRLLKKMPKIGNEQLKDQEEEMNANHAEVPVDTMRHAVKPKDGAMMTQTTKDLDLINNARPGLQRHYSQAEELLGASYALYYGYSRNVLQSSRWSGHSFIKTISHPHIFVAGQGKVSYGSTDYPSTSGYETQVATDIAAVTASDVLDSNTLKGLKANRNVRRISPLIMRDGNKLRLLVVHPYVLATLENDTSFKSLHEQAYVERTARDNPLLFGVRYIAHGFAIFESDTAVQPCRSASSLPEFGPSGINGSSFTGDFETWESYQTDTVFANFILGSNAIFKGIATAMQFIGREDDYGHLKGLAYDIIQGYSRGDSWNRDDGTLGDNVINDGSALVISYAPEPQI